MVLDVFLRSKFVLSGPFTCKADPNQLSPEDQLVLHPVHLTHGLVCAVHQEDLSVSDTILLVSLGSYGSFISHRAGVPDEPHLTARDVLVHLLHVHHHHQ